MKKDSKVTWKNEEERRASFVEAFNMVGRSDQEIDEAMKRLTEYAKLLWQVVNDYQERGELHVLEEMIAADKRKIAKEAEANRQRLLRDLET